jgi:hypothetical protein
MRFFLKKIPITCDLKRQIFYIFHIAISQTIYFLRFWFKITHATLSLSLFFFFTKSNGLSYCHCLVSNSRRLSVVLEYECPRANLFLKQKRRKKKGEFQVLVGDSNGLTRKLANLHANGDAPADQSNPTSQPPSRDSPTNKGRQLLLGSSYHLRRWIPPRVNPMRWWILSARRCVVHIATWQLLFTIIIIIFNISDCLININKVGGPNLSLFFKVVSFG